MPAATLRHDRCSRQALCCRPVQRLLTRAPGSASRRRSASMTSRDFNGRPSRQASIAARNTRFASRKRARVSEIFRLQVGERSAVDRARGFRHARLRPALRRIPIVSLGLDRRALFRARQLQPIAQIFNNRFSKRRNVGSSTSPPHSARDACSIGAENFRMRIAAFGQLKQQFVQVESAHEPLGGNWSWRRRFPRTPADTPPIDPTRKRAAAEKAAARPCRPDFGPLAPRANKREATVFAGERFDDAAGVPVRVLVQHVGAAPAIRAARMAGPRSSQCVVPELAQCHFAVRPVFLDLDP